MSHFLTPLDPPCADKENHLVNLVMTGFGSENAVKTFLVLNRSSDTYELRKNPRRSSSFKFVETLWQPEIQSIHQNQEQLIWHLTSGLQDIRVEE